MLWSHLSIQTVREENHTLLVRAAYRTPGPKSLSDWTPLGRRSLDKIESIIAQELGDREVGGHQQEYASALKRCGITAIQAGGSFVVENSSGESTLVRGAEYAELLERALSKPQSPSAPDPVGFLQPEEFYTPNVKTIAQVGEFSGLPAVSQIKSLVMIADGATILVLLRGDHQMSDTKFAFLTKASMIRQATADEIRTKFGADAGSLGPVGVQGIRILADTALEGRRNMISGANKNDYHLRHVTPGKDFTAEYVDLRLAMPGDTERQSGAPLEFVPVDIIASADDILEAAAAQHHDADGLTLPRPIAPYSVVITPVHPERLDAAREIYHRLLAAGVDAMLDDRDARPGVKFKDADLIGFPYRINVGKKFTDGLLELVVRSPKSSVDLSVEQAIRRVCSEWVC